MKTLCMLAAFMVWQTKKKKNKNKKRDIVLGCIIAYHGITFKCEVINNKDSTDWLI